MRKLPFFSRTRFLWLSSVVVVVALLVGAAIGIDASTGYDYDDMASPALVIERCTSAPGLTSTLQTTATSAPPTTTPSAAAVDPSPIVFTGRGAKATETFHVERTRFKVRWTTETADATAFFFLSVYQEGQEFATADASFRGSGSDSTVVRSGPGDFYIEVITGTAWQIEVMFD